MNLGQIVAKARVRVQDTVDGPFLWSAEEMVDFANQAEREADERGKLLESDADVATAVVTITQAGGLATATGAHPFMDGQPVRIAGANEDGYDVDAAVSVVDGTHFTFAVDPRTASPATGTITASLIAGIMCNIAGLANVSVYQLPAKIIEVRSVRWQDRLLNGIDLDELNYSHRFRSWKAATGQPTHFIDPQEKYLTLFRKPTVDAPIHLAAYHYPLLDMVLDSDSPEIPEIHHFNTIDWIEYLCFSKDDTEVQDLPRADRAAAKFTVNFGPKIDANTRRSQRNRSSNQVRMSRSW